MTPEIEMGCENDESSMSSSESSIVLVVDQGSKCLPRGGALNIEKECEKAEERKNFEETVLKKLTPNQGSNPAPERETVLEVELEENDEAPSYSGTVSSVSSVAASATLLALKSEVARVNQTLSSLSDQIAKIETPPTLGASEFQPNHDANNFIRTFLDPKLSEDQKQAILNAHLNLLKRGF